MLKKAVGYYHQLLEQGDLIERTRQQLWQRLSDMRFVFGGRMLSPFLRPHFITRSQFKMIKAVCEGLWGAIMKVGEHALTDETLLQYLGVTDLERGLVKIDPGFRGVSRTSRLDSFLTEKSYQFVELNAETPAGIAYADVASEIFRELDVMKQFRERYRVTPLSGREKLLDVLLAAYREFSGQDKKPNIAIVDLRGLPTEREFELFREFFQSRGFNTVIADPRELEFRQGKLYAGDFAIDLIYKRLLVNEFIEVLDEAWDLLRAYEARAVCLVNSFRGKLVHKKLLFGVLTDEQFSHYFTDEEKALIHRHIPWTRRFEERKTQYNGQEIDLVEFTRNNRERLVLKPNDEYGGKGIFIGWESDEAVWDEAISTALQNAYLVQERVTTSREVFPWIIGEAQVDFVEQLIDLDPLLFDGKVGSAFTRLSSTELCNVTAGGGMVPTFILEDEGERQ
jgi:hypothetical protein